MPTPPTHEAAHIFKDCSSISSALTVLYDRVFSPGKSVLSWRMFEPRRMVPPGGYHSPKVVRHHRHNSYDFSASSPTFTKARTNKIAPIAKHKNAAITNPTTCTSPTSTLPDENIQPKNCNPAPCSMFLQWMNPTFNLHENMAFKRTQRRS